jgi:hypothetical protein
MPLRYPKNQDFLELSFRIQDLMKPILWFNPSFFPFCDFFDPYIYNWK